MDMTLSNLTPAPPAPAVSIDAPLEDGLLHYKYMPRTGAWGEADVAYVTLTPTAALQRVELGVWRGQGTVQFHRATWEDLPTQYTIVNAIHQLEIKEYRGATVVQSVGATDLSEQRMPALTHHSTSRDGNREARQEVPRAATDDSRRR